MVVPLTAPKHEEPTRTRPEASLTEDEKHFAEQLKVDPKKIAQFKARRRGRPPYNHTDLGRCASGGPWRRMP